MRINHTLARLQNQDIALGCALQQYRSAEIPRALAAAGFDYVFIDAEHSSFDLETIHDMISSAVGAGITPLVRVAELHYSLVARFLDAGAQGIILPRVESRPQLEEAISWMRFPPLGKRGFGVMAPLLDYKESSAPEIIAHLNANTMVIAQIETRTAIERMDDLLSAPGIDVAMVGPSDLSVSLGVAGDMEHPKLTGAISQFIEACQKHGVVPGIHCRSAEQANGWIQKGMRFVGAGGEHGLLFEKAQETVTRLRTTAGTALR
ncbi:MAG: HpcH/HpaI aldolase family protein [Terriglobia bacterium]